MGKFSTEQITNILETYNLTKSLRETAIRTKIGRPQITSLLLQKGVKLHIKGPTPNNWVGEDQIQCSMCNIVKHTKEYTYSTNNDNRDGYYYSYCKYCAREKYTTRRKKWAATSPWYERCVAQKSRAKRKKTDFNLTPEFLEELYEKQGRVCFYTERPIRIEVGVGLVRDAASLDRIIPEKGYVQGNVVIVSFRANTIKNNMTLDEMKEWMPKWYNKLKKWKLI